MTMTNSKMTRANTFFIFLFLSLLGIVHSSQAQNRGLPDFSDLIERHSPAVVKINTTTKAKARSRSNPQLDQIPEFFRPFIDPQPRNREMQSMGSGFFIDSTGYIITNNHVIEGADEIVVRLTDRSEYEAKLIGADKSSDLALLKVDSKTRFDYLKLGSSTDLKIGEWVLAIGSPFGLDFSASVGIVSAKGRSIPTEDGANYVPFIQSDVAINPGNSGGPLFNLQGEVVGVNSQIYSRSGGSIGLSFAIPANTVKNVVDQLRDKGRVDRGWLGVMIDDVDRDLASAFGLKRPTGALVQQVVDNGPADKAGIRSGDIILAFNGVDIKNASMLPPVVGNTAPGEKVKVKVMRKKREKTLNVLVETLGGEKMSGDSGSSPSATYGGSLGMLVEKIDAEARERSGISKGVLVTRVVPDGPADETGIRPGDIITEINFEEVASTKTFEKLIKNLPAGKPLPIRFARNGNFAFRTIEIPEGKK